MTAPIKLLIAIFIFTALGLGVAYFAGASGALSYGLPVFFLCALWAYFVNWSAFIPASFYKTEKYYDLTGAFTYITMMGWAVYFTDEVNIRAIVIAVLVAIWSLRLGGFLYSRIRKEKGDRRFDEIKINPLRFFLTWTLQAAWVVLTSACALAVITTNKAVTWDVWATIGLLLWLTGFLYEVIADAQKSAFRKKTENKGRFIRTGLWSRSQHPNYFGEILLWTGIAVMALPVLQGGAWIALISPFFIAFLLIRVSGIPLLQKSAKVKWGDDPDFKIYHANTPLLIPKLF